MAIQVGDPIPSARLKTPTADGIEEVSTDDFFAGKQGVLFAVPGAFTPTCSDTHLPGFVVRGPEILAKGVDAIACLAVNDVFVMGAWAKARNVDASIAMLADGNGELTRAMGLELDLSHVGLGVRSRRYAALVEDGVIKVLNVEPGAAVGVSSADTILAAL